MITRHGLVRSLRRVDTLALSFGAMIGWSWVALISEVIARSGTLGALVATALAGLVILVIGYIYAELAAAMPDVGGEHVYSLRALGGGASFVCTWAIIFTYVSVAGFEAVALPSVMENLFPGLGAHRLWEVNGAPVYLEHALLGAGASVVITWINVRGIRIAATVQGIVVGVILLAGVALFAGLGASGETARLSPLFVGGVGGVAAAMAMIPFFMVGFDIIPQAAEEIDLDRRKIGSLLVTSIAAAIVWYLLIELAVGMLLSAEERAGADLATIEAARSAWGSGGAVLLMVGGVAGILTSWNSFLIGGSRAIFALAEAGMLPRVLARVHPKHHTPVNALLFVGAVGFAAPFLGRQSLLWFVNAGSLGVLIAYLYVAVSFRALRRHEPGMERPFRAPGGMALAWAGIVLSLAMATLFLPGMPAALAWPHEWAMVGGWCVLGGVLYVVRPGRRGKGGAGRSIG